MKILLLCLVLISGIATAQGNDETLNAANVAGCEPEPDDPMVVEALSHDSGGLQVVASLGSEDGESMGDLCVGLVKADPRSVTAVARLQDGSLDIPAPMTPLTGRTVEVEPVLFRYAPGREAVGVRVTATYISSSTRFAASRLYLFAWNDTKLVPIFNAEMNRQSSGQESAAKIVYFDQAMHRGVFDLVLSGTARKSLQRYIWNGTRYTRS